MPYIGLWYYMTASYLLRVSGMALALITIAVSSYFPQANSEDTGYMVVTRAFSGLVIIIGSLSVFSTLETTLLRSGGNYAFKTLFLASFASTGLGIVVAASGILPLNVYAGAIVVAFVYLISGLLILRFYARCGE